MTVTCWWIDLSKLGDGGEERINIQIVFVAEGRDRYQRS